MNTYVVVDIFVGDETPVEATVSTTGSGFGVLRIGAYPRQRLYYDSADTVRAHAEALLALAEDMDANHKEEV